VSAVETELLVLFISCFFDVEPLIGNVICGTIKVFIMEKLAPPFKEK
jgi:hypothetical protein